MGKYIFYNFPVDFLLWLHYSPAVLVCPVPRASLSGLSPNPSRLHDCIMPSGRSNTCPWEVCHHYTWAGWRNRLKLPPPDAELPFLAVDAVDACGGGDPASPIQIMGSGISTFCLILSRVPGNLKCALIGYNLCLNCQAVCLASVILLVSQPPMTSIVQLEYKGPEAEVARCCRLYQGVDVCWWNSNLSMSLMGSFGVNTERLAVSSSTASSIVLSLCTHTVVAQPAV